MKRIFLFFAVLFALLISSPSVCFATEDSHAPVRLALLETDTGAIGGSINYFVLRPVMEYDNREGVCESTMFDGVIFALRTPPKSAAAAEGFITTLFKDGTCIPAAETVAGEMKEDGYLSADTKYPIYAAVPYVSGLFTDSKGRNEFCRYYIDTFVTLFNGAEYKHIRLAGLYFSADYDADPSLRNSCISMAKGKGLQTVASTALGGVEADTVFASNAKLDAQLKQGNGISLTLGGVPTDTETEHYNALSSDFAVLKQKAIGERPILIGFSAYNDLYDCASAIEASLPSEKARQTYELVKQIIDCNYGQSTPSDNLPTEEGRVAKGWEYALYTLLALIGTAGFGYLTYGLIRKGMENGDN